MVQQVVQLIEDSPPPEPSEARPPRRLYELACPGCGASLTVDEDQAEALEDIDHECGYVGRGYVRPLRRPGAAVQPAGKEPKLQKRRPKE